MVRQDTDTTERLMMRKVRFVMDEILAMLPSGAEKDVRYTMMKTFMYESLKDLAMIPDRIISQMTSDMANALAFIANGSDEDFEAAVAAKQERENAGNLGDNAEEG